ncbi:MAG: Pseudouridine synthase [Deltaproteobacteria bacterium]|nr:Pseudouridine synthase [Deltaproteobacteria bacterium]
MLRVLRGEYSFTLNPQELFLWSSPVDESKNYSTVGSMVDQVASAKTPSWLVPAQSASLRLDAFLRRAQPHLSRRTLDQAIGEKLFLINGRAGKKGDRLAAGDSVAFCGPAAWLAEQPPPAARFAVPIVYEDDTILALDKPAGMATHGFSARDDATLANFLLTRWPELYDVGKSRWEPGLVHRLDVETSGLILVAKTQAAFASLRAQFRRREVSKTYWALVWGDTVDRGTIDLPLAHDGSNKRKMRVIIPSGSGKPPRTWRAATQYRKMGAAHGMSLLEIVMATGVTHQIRVHLAAIGCPIVGDVLYGDQGKEKFGLERHFLHARGLEFRHPGSQRAVQLESKIPGDLTEVLERLGLTF